MARDEFDQILLGGGGPAYFSFGKQPVAGSFIEGVVVEKKSRHKLKYQTKQQKDAGLPQEFEYFVGKAKTASTLALAEYVKTVSNAKAVQELIVHLQTNLRDPEKEKDDGLRTFVFPWRAQALLAERVRAQFADGLPVGAFIRVRLTALVPVEGLSEPKREYEVLVWGPGEQPTPSPAQPQPVYQPPVQQVYQQPVQQFQQPQQVFQQPVQPVYPQQTVQHVTQQPVQQPVQDPWATQPVAPVAQQFQPQGGIVYTQAVLDMMKGQGMAAPPQHPNYQL